MVSRNLQKNISILAFILAPNSNLNHFQEVTLPDIKASKSRKIIEEKKHLLMLKIREKSG